ncbi:MAG TPA: M23 family metallopeptidase [Pseudolysinimonas sp.]|nr:M23 family metallopeptidase [Pseudolysinimonas sp.]
MTRAVGRGPTRVIAIIVALAFFPVAGIVGTAPAIAAQKVDYPSWQDVQNAQASEAAAAAQIAKIKGLLAALAAEVASTQADATAKGEAYAKAQSAYDNQAFITQQYKSQAEAAEAEAANSKKAAGQLLSELSRTGGGGDVTASLIAESGKADQLLYRLGAMSKLSERSEDIYAQALRQQKTAQALTDQAKVAEQKLEELKAAAEAAFKVAQAAADAALAKQAEQQANQAQMEAQLAVLTQKRVATQADYTAGIQAQWGANAGGVISAQGWARPAAGYITSPFGMRYHPIYHVWTLHTGTDLGGTGCGGPIYAAHSGTVSYAGPNGDLGNFIEIEHGDGTTSGYGHIANGGIHVRIGQHVDPGQPIASIGATGGATGCHLHFMIRINGNLTDPVPFMRDRGVGL